MPAAVLVLFVLAAIAVDQSLVFTRQRDLVAAAQAAANDAAGFGLDTDTFYAGDRIEFSLARAQAAAAGSLRARGIDDPPTVTLNADRTRVVVTVHTTVDYLFSPVVPGAPHSTTVEAHADADLISR